MSNTTKSLSSADSQQVLQGAFNDSDKSLTTSGFATSKVGAKITRTEVQASPVIEDWRFLDVVQTFSSTTSNGFPIVTLITSTGTLSAGQYVSGSGIPVNTTILSVDSPTQITLSANATASATVSLKYANLLYRLRVEYDDAAKTNVVSTERLD